MIKYRIRTIRNCLGEEVDDSYECTTAFDLDDRTKTTDINRAMSWCQTLSKANPKGIYEVVEVKEGE